MAHSRPKPEGRSAPAKRVVHRDEDDFRPSDHHKRMAGEQAPLRPRKSRRLERSQGKKYDKEALFGEDEVRPLATNLLPARSKFQPRASTSERRTKYNTKRQSQVQSQSLNSANSKSRRELQVHLEKSFQQRIPKSSTRDPRHPPPPDSSSDSGRQRWEQKGFSTTHLRLRSPLATCPRLRRLIRVRPVSLGLFLPIDPVPVPAHINTPGPLARTPTLAPTPPPAFSAPEPASVPAPVAPVVPDNNPIDLLVFMAMLMSVSTTQAQAQNRPTLPSPPSTTTRA
ncbi:hypothetical protein NEUTE1DRAFT_148302 [Neurospora tetrasperma FGSC 2508]|uniref:Uncharacterized protein n=1 Tax=Neurospora tetrasperma (strain FGSC 2508 / ATCC MYA-4615 / P0657) TaxID=510951 RepID=F8MSG3_NEUT8|nr:uncharacterized protein NEUTE1DRAFT_148302 [Neurospora tetrasperma FGSC 2508]EGO55903.1 hypothetical protein NEUTE1DRAFT_148302 [Neurospora tetrasperma FGSC 2508]EGZ68839.1 hypothetical protein NEUTE2DRAFT_159444 [Neurospora tetrasperma FGSC 2509]